MMPFIPGLPARGPLTVLCLGAHADDIEIGCGGTILRLLAERRRVTVYWVILTANTIRDREARRTAARILRGAAASHLRIEHFRDGFLPYAGAEVKEVFEQLKPVAPDLIFTHRGDDAHQDHRLVSQLTWNTFRNHSILEYEIPKYDGELGLPNVFVPLPPAIRRKKVRAIMAGFPSQRTKRWFTEETFEGLMRIRGVECAADEGYAEGFYARKLIFRPTESVNDRSKRSR
jgi:LmbE family N-acetylglucosaminyl deacetylase